MGNAGGRKEHAGSVPTASSILIGRTDRQDGDRGFIDR